MTSLKLHRRMAIVLAVFLALHFATHLSGVFGIEAYNETQRLLRYIYRNPVIEPVVLLTVLVQTGLGFGLLLRRFRRGIHGHWERVQLTSGAVLLLFLAQHLTAMALARWVEGLDTNFFWPASVMSGAPFAWYFVPYYFLGVSALFVHLGCAARLGLLRRGQRQHATIGFWGFAVTGAGLALLIIFMLMGAFYEIDLPEAWVVYLQNLVPGHAV